VIARLGSTGSEAAVIGSGVARHACDAGCQIILLSGRIPAGQRIALRIEEGQTIRATVRWAVADRIALVFDRAIPEDIQKRLTRLHGRALQLTSLAS
jgi:hypothetical protein